MRLAGKVAIVTGSGGGMGEEEARLFAREGARVVVADVLEEQGQQIVKEIGDAGGEAIFVRLDVTNEANWQAVIATTIEQFGKLNVMVNNAGIVGPLDPEDNVDTEAWDRLMDVNAKGVFLGIKHAIPEMRKDGGGSIVNISSISGFIGQSRIHPGYNASKGAVRILTKSFAVKHASENIRVNSVHPGIMPPMREQSPAAEQRVREMVPMGRVGRRDEVANAVLFLASDDASYITGTELVVDGGYLAL
ncbi:MAG: glucose 1-dehydrogenase [Candidatus Tectomicrobia bacterium]|nr:glucose 1-dehydrogenase [Candidatus Tectomicrobia bacterium]